MSRNFQQIDEVSAANTLGEGVQWCSEDQTIWWTDILECKLYRYCWQAKNLEVISTPEPLGSFVFTDEPGVIVAAFATGFAFFNWKDGRVQWLHQPAFLPGEDRFNYGRADRQGRFWSGTIIANLAPSTLATGRLFCLDTDQSLSVHEQAIAISNGIGWSPDSETMYFADSLKGDIYQYGFDPQTGTLSDRELFVRVPRGGGPDGAAVDARGNVWSAQWAAGKILAFDPTGEIIADVPVPTSQPTCVAFGGPDLNLMIVTSARDGLTTEQLDHQPSAGNVFIFETDVQGLPEEIYKGRAPSTRA